MENAENDGTVKCSLLKKYVDMRDMWLFEYGNTIWGVGILEDGYRPIQE